MRLGRDDVPDGVTMVAPCPVMRNGRNQVRGLTPLGPPSSAVRLPIDFRYEAKGQVETSRVA